LEAANAPLPSQPTLMKSCDRAQFPLESAAMRIRVKQQERGKVSISGSLPGLDDAADQTARLSLLKPHQSAATVAQPLETSPIEGKDMVRYASTNSTLQPINFGTIFFRNHLNRKIKFILNFGQTVDPFGSQISKPLACADFPIGKL